MPGPPIMEEEEDESSESHHWSDVQDRMLYALANQLLDVVVLRTLS